MRRGQSQKASRLRVIVTTASLIVTDTSLGHFLKAYALIVVTDGFVDNYMGDVVRMVEFIIGGVVTISKKPHDVIINVKISHELLEVCYDGTFAF